MSFYTAILKGENTSVKYYIASGVNVNEIFSSERNQTPLIVAVRTGRYKIAKMLLVAGAKKTIEYEHCGNTALHYAAREGYKKIVSLLLEYGADIEKLTNQRNTALIFAAAGGHKSTVQVLINAGANIHHKNENGHTALRCATDNRQSQTAKVLYDKQSRKN